MNQHLIYRFFLILCICFYSFSLSQASTLEEVIKRDRLICGVDEQHYGFSYLNEEGKWDGFEVDLCRALASSIFNNPNKVQFIPLNTQTRFTALRDKNIDILLRSTTWTFSRDLLFDFDFPAITYYDRLSILAHKKTTSDTFEEITDGTLCVAKDSTTLETLRRLIRGKNKEIIIKAFNSREGLTNIFFSGQCDYYAADYSALYPILHTQAPRLEDYKFIDVTYTKEPLGPVVRQHDRQWFDLVRWLVYGLLEAEEKGLDKDSLSNIVIGNDPAVDFLLGFRPGLGAPFGLNDKWLHQALSQVGHYGQIFEKNLGQNSPFKMERGLNALWTKCGLHYPIPIR